MCIFLLVSLIIAAAAASLISTQLPAYKYCDVFRCVYAEAFERKESVIVNQ